MWDSLWEDDTPAPMSSPQAMLWNFAGKFPVLGDTASFYVDAGVPTLVMSAPASAWREVLGALGAPWPNCRAPEFLLRLVADGIVIAYSKGYGDPIEIVKLEN